MSSIKVLSRRPILSTELFDVIETKLDVKGKLYTHHNIHRPSIVSVFPITSEGDLCLISQYRYLHDETFLEEIAGHVDKGEDPLAGAKRELKEETGIVAKKWEKFAEVISAGSVVKNRIHFFLARELTFGKPNPEDYEEIALVKMTLSDAVNYVLSGKIKNSAAALGILMLSIMKQRGEI